jgi:hypothetical protein
MVAVAIVNATKDALASAVAPILLMIECPAGSTWIAESWNRSNVEVMKNTPPCRRAAVHGRHDATSQPKNGRRPNLCSPISKKRNPRDRHHSLPDSKGTRGRKPPTFNQDPQWPRPLLNPISLKASRNLPVARESGWTRSFFN